MRRLAVDVVLLAVDAVLLVDALVKCRVLGHPDGGRWQRTTRGQICVCDRCGTVIASAP